MMRAVAGNIDQSGVRRRNGHLNEHRKAWHGNASASFEPFLSQWFTSVCPAARLIAHDMKTWSRAPG